jgi:hypothetical protein
MKASARFKWRGWLWRALAAAALGVTLAAYAQPDFAFELANRWFLCA